MLIHDNTKLNELIARWDSDEGKPYKGSLIDRAAFEANPDSLGCMCAQGQILHVVRGMTPQEIMAIESQKLADEMVMQELGISRGHAILLRQVNDSVSGAPSIVLTEPEKVLGEHAGLVLAFFKYLDAMSADDWKKYNAAWDAAWDAARDAAWAANEIQGHNLLKERGKPLFFLSLFGFQTIEALIDWAAS